MTLAFDEEAIHRAGSGPARPTPEQSQYAAELAHQQRDEPLTADTLWLVDMLVQTRFQSIAYASYVLPTIDGSAHGYFWITSAHARALGEILRGASAVAATAWGFAGRGCR